MLSREPASSKDEKYRETVIRDCEGSDQVINESSLVGGMIWMLKRLTQTEECASVVGISGNIPLAISTIG